MGKDPTCHMCMPTEAAFLWVIWFRTSHPRSLGSGCIRGTKESTLVTDSSVTLMNYDLNGPGSLILIQITPKECTLKDSLMASKIWELLEPRKSGIDIFISSPVSHSLILFAPVSILYGLLLTVSPDSSHMYVVQPRAFHSPLTVLLLVIFCLLCLPVSSGVKVRAPWQLSLNKVLKSMSSVC